MTSTEFFAFVALPLCVAALGWAIALAAGAGDRHGDVNH
jgi:hypothetical protein